MSAQNKTSGHTVQKDGKSGAQARTFEKEEPKACADGTFFEEGSDDTFEAQDPDCVFDEDWECTSDTEELKTWLFQENIRLQAAREELERLREQVEKEKEAANEELKRLGHRMETDRKKLEQENRFFDQKMQILQSGFAQLDADRRRFLKEKDKFDAKKEVFHDEQSYYQRMEMAEMLFRGVNSLLALKKRYKDLIKMYHPDNVAGDHEMVQIINREYEELKKAYDIGKNA